MAVFMAPLTVKVHYIIYSDYKKQSLYKNIQVTTIVMIKIIL